MTMTPAARAPISSNFMSSLHYESRPPPAAQSRSRHSSMDAFIVSSSSFRSLSLRTSAPCKSCPGRVVGR